MSAGRAVNPLKRLTRHAGICTQGARRITTSAATQAQPTADPIQHSDSASLSGITSAFEGLSLTANPTSTSPQTQPPNTVLTTVYAFPRMEPLRYAYYSKDHLQLPLRRDILHRAVIFEGDSERQGTASTKWRSEVHGSGRKLMPQKGQGRARVGDKKSPIRKGGGVAFGPKPRDFSTKLPRKIYDLAWRTALSYRYRRGELVLVDMFGNPKTTAPWWSEQIFTANGWNTGNGKSMLVAEARDSSNEKWFKAIERDYDNGKGPKMTGRIKSADEVDVKDLLSMGRVIIEYRALNRILHEHNSDLVQEVPIVGKLFQQ